MTRALCTLLLLLTACTPRTLSVQHEYLDRRYLASSYAETVDPRQCNYCGEMLIVRWRKLCQGDHLTLTLRFHNQEEREVAIPLNRRCGSYCYRLLNQQWRCVGGILTYKVELTRGGEVVETFEHQIWTELVKVSV